MKTYEWNGIQMRPTRRSAIAIDKRKLLDGVRRCGSLQKANRTTRLPATVNRMIRIIPKPTENDSIVRHGNDIIDLIYQYLVRIIILRGSLRITLFTSAMNI